MRVLLITANFHPEKTGISVTATDCARFISAFGHEVNVVCGMPYYPEWRIREGYQNKIFLTERLESLTIKRVWLYVPKIPSPLKRILHELSFFTLALLRGLAQRFDLVVCISPPLTAGLASAFISMLRRKKLWFYVQDVQPDAAIELGMLRNPHLIRFLLWIEKYIYDRSSKIFVLSEGMKKNLIAKGVDESKITIVPVSIEVRALAISQNKKDRYWKRYGLESKFVVLYSGNLGVKQNPAIIVECARLLKEQKNIFFAIVGDGALRSKIETMIQDSKLQNVKLFPLCERSELGHMLHSADVLLAPQRKEVVDFAMPSKLLAYFTSRRPVIASANAKSELARVIQDYQTGVLVEPENPRLLADAIVALRLNGLGAHQLAENAFRYVASMHSHEVVREKYYKPLFENLNVN